MHAPFFFYLETPAWMPFAFTVVVVFSSFYFLSISCYSSSSLSFIIVCTHNVYVKPDRGAGANNKIGTQMFSRMSFLSSCNTLAFFARESTRKRQRLWRGRIPIISETTMVKSVGRSDGSNLIMSFIVEYRSSLMRDTSPPGFFSSDTHSFA